MHEGAVQNNTAPYPLATHYKHKQDISSKVFSKKYYWWGFLLITFWKAQLLEKINVFQMDQKNLCFCFRTVVTMELYSRSFQYAGFPLTHQWVSNVVMVDSSLTLCQNSQTVNQTSNSMWCTNCLFIGNLHNRLRYFNINLTTWSVSLSFLWNSLEMLLANSFASCWGCLLRILLKTGF